MQDKEGFRFGVLVGFVISVLVGIFTLLWFGQNLMPKDIIFFGILLIVFISLMAWVGIGAVLDRKHRINPRIGYGHRRN